MSSPVRRFGADDLAWPREHESSLSVVRGRMRLEFGPGSRQRRGVGGQFLHVPAHTVHREPGRHDSEMSTAVIARAGDGPPTTNVDGADLDRT